MNNLMNGFTVLGFIRLSKPQVMNAAWCCRLCNGYTHILTVTWSCSGSFNLRVVSYVPKESWGKTTYHMYTVHCIACTGPLIVWLHCTILRTVSSYRLIQFRKFNFVKRLPGSAARWRGQESYKLNLVRMDSSDLYMGSVWNSNHEHYELHIGIQLSLSRGTGRPLGQFNDVADRKFFG